MFFRLTTLFGLLFFVSSVFALVFSITPRGALPTSVFSGDTVTAYYRVENNTGEQRNTNSVKYLPPNVTQVTTGGHYTNTCGAPFNLAPNGSTGDTCTLQLTVSGTVNANDPNPRHHLFACFPGGMSCAGTSYPLNVTEGSNNLVSITIEEDNDGTLVPGSSFTFHRLAQQQFTATGTYDDGSQRNITGEVTWNSSNTSAATVSSTGLVTGASAIGSTNLTASLDAITSNTLALSFNDFAYVGDSLGNLYSCPISNSDGTLGQCSTTNSFATAVSHIVVDPNYNYVYLIVSGNSLIYACSVNNDGSLGTCATTGGSAGYSDPLSIAVNAAGSAIYVGSINNSDGLIYSCQLSNGVVSGCSSSNTSATGGANSLAANSTGTYGFSVIGNGLTTGQVFSSSIAGNAFQAPYTSTASGVTQPLYILLNSDSTFAYISSYSSVLSVCSVSSGVLSSCASTGSQIGTMSLQFGCINIGINPINTYFYVISSPSSNGVYSIQNCPITGGSVGVCNSNPGATTGISSPVSIGIL